MNNSVPTNLITDEIDQFLERPKLTQREIDTNYLWSLPKTRSRGTTYNSF